MVVYGHTPVPEPEWVNNTICLDTGVVFGGALTALRYPERELVCVPAEQQWYEPVRPLAPSAARSRAARRPQDRRRRRHSLARNHSRREGQDPGGERRRRARGHEPLRGRPALAHLPAADDVASRDLTARRATWSTQSRRSRSTPGWGVDPRRVRGEAHGLSRHRRHRQGPRRRAAPLRGRRRQRPAWSTPARAGPSSPTPPSSSTGLRVTAAPLFESLDTDWLALDCELLPWSAKAMDLIKSQYASVGAAAREVLPEAVYGPGAGCRARPRRRRPAAATRSAARQRRRVPRRVRGATSTRPTGSTG